MTNLIFSYFDIATTCNYSVGTKVQHGNNENITYCN